MDKHSYNLTVNEVFTKYSVTEKGLSDEKVLAKSEKFGPNKLPEGKSFSLWLLFFRQFQSTLIYILLIAAAISFILNDIINMWVILAAVGLNVVVGFFQEFRAQRALEQLRKVVTQYATVKRNGHELQIETEKLVPGDLVILKAGDKVPADIRLIKTTDLKVNEASLTGESFPVDKISETLPAAVIIAEQKNKVFMGTTIATGNAEGVVVDIGQKTEIGKIASLIKSTAEEETPLQKKLAKLGKSLGVLILGLSLVIFLIGIILKYDFKEMFTTAVAVAVSAIPEGLVVVVTVILAIGMQRILKQDALVRKLIAAETLGSVSIICTDKTGTLTEGRMRVAKIITHDHDLDAANYKINFQQSNITQQTYYTVLKIGLLASDAYIENPTDAFEHMKVIGSPTEKALVLAAYQAGFDQDKFRQENPRLEEIPFDSDKKYMVTLHKDKDSNKEIYIKGAPEKIINFSTMIDLDGQVENFTASRKKKIDDEYKKLSSEGLRILALAYKKVDKKYEDLHHDEKLFEDVIFVGFVGIKDPLRKEAASTIKLCQQAGIRTVMLTGDHKLTAQAIAKELNLPADKKNIIEGEEFEKLNKEQLEKRIADISVYARINPQDKLRIVDAWQERGEVVAMTGDGINDAPALKSADIGVALGSGTDVAKETANMVLLNNNFSTIVKAVEQGRIIYANIKKVILYLMSDGFTEMIVVVGGLLFGWPLPLLAAQILWINLVSDGFPNIALTMEKGDKDIMKSKPIPSKQSIMDFETKFLIVLISALSGILALGIFYWIWKTTGDIDKARTMTFAAVAVNSLLYVFSCRSTHFFIWQKKMFSNKYLLFAVALGFVLQLVAIYLPFFQNVFQTVSLDLNDWLIVFSVGLIDIIAIEISKWFFIHRHQEAKTA
ncbi:MAG: HAD-IC family P-type ATPase [bacterium]|nr:HAD-IC family P-type ATPase [bacterium]